MSSFRVVPLPEGKRPYDEKTVLPLRYRPPYADAAGVPMQKIAGRLVYKPAGLGQLALRFVNGYRVTADRAYLKRADAIAKVFQRIGRHSGGGLYLPYTFDFAMHENPRDIIRRPWYSAMAQGLALSLFTRMWKATGEDAYRATARQLYESLRHIGRGRTPWVSYIDAGGYLWLEEYAQAQPEHTLNGFNYAVFGLYDWYQATRDPDALQTLRGALTTLKAHLARFRNAGHRSYYCLKHHHVASSTYHAVHVWQLRMMTRITRDVFFSQMAGRFERDAR